MFMKNQFTIEPENLNNFKYKVNVPVYQRPYCWREDEIEKLLEDFFGNQDHEIYFIGNIISISNNGVYDLIDGQQRFTTLWILCLYLANRNKHKQDYADLIKFCKIEDEPRLSFSIRKQTNRYLKELLVQNELSIENSKFWKINHLLLDSSDHDEQKAEFEQNKSIANAFSIIDNWVISNKTISLGFLLKKITFQFLVAPEGTDENKLFIQINTNGTQLQHYDILKSELINAIFSENRSKYSNVWDEMSSKYYSVLKSNSLQEDALTAHITLKEIVNEVFNDNNEHSDVDEFDEVKKSITEDYLYEYIIDFNTLLIHTLYIFQKKHGLNFNIEAPKIFDREQLLKVFENLRAAVNEKNNKEIRNEIAQEFINTLKVVRDLIDKHIIFKDLQNNTFGLFDKKIEIEDEEIKYEKYEKELEQLQRMLYHSNWDKKHFWLGLYLDFLLQDKNQQDYLKTLEKIDNVLSGSDHSFKTYTNYFIKDKALHYHTIKDFSLTDNFKFGTIQRYWFYKLEYLLWKESQMNSTNYKIVSRTSVEHILPQINEKYFWENDIDIHTFGNLGLLSVSENSTFSDSNLIHKSIYLDKMNNAPIKLKMLFDKLARNNLIKKININGEFDEAYDFSKLKDCLKEHEQEMLNKLEGHYSSIK